MSTIDNFNLKRVNQTDTGDNSEVAKALAEQAEKIKKEAERMLFVMQEAQQLALGENPAADPAIMNERRRRFAVAKTELESAVMWAVKGLFVNYL